ncbi:methyltransferase [uncultured Winogradskyella sp.]|uniref:tRNA1(Val) (adenine(37)-N6)-methyltransferase n=1 Tax=uncultured Winogradskyella sp. TaxID=395353 RepID=UPI00260B271B|nr:methyltransferase [uncultured Winogradskyella sp.]
MEKPFQFKKFTIEQDRCAMKVGTDGVLLGAWTSVKNNPFSILDIGSGTGILALMLAQRSGAELIEAIEIDANAYEQCVGNFENSPWNDRLFCYHASLLEFVDDVDDTFDLIICNPPFYFEDYKSNIKSRDLARFNDAMPFKHIIYAVAKLLSKEGLFSIIIPKKEELNLIQLAASVKIFPSRILNVKGNSNTKIKRCLIEFTFHNVAVKISELVIETDRHNYTEDYINLTKAFYLNM